jgi:hypothetical protein
MIFPFTFSKSNDIIDLEKVIRKKKIALRIPIFIIIENGLVFLFSKKPINAIKRKETITSTIKSLTSLYAS